MKLASTDPRRPNSCGTADAGVPMKLGWRLKPNWTTVGSAPSILPVVLVRASDPTVAGLGLTGSGDCADDIGVLNTVIGDMLDTVGEPTEKVR